MASDPFEEFEFKPLTEGLGFHAKKAQQTPAPTPAAPQVQFTTSAMDFAEEVSPNPLRSPLPRKEAKMKAPVAEPNSTTSAVDDILNTLKKNRALEIETDRQHRQELRNSKRVEVWKTAAPKFSPLLLDGMLIMASGLMCLIIVLLITQVDLIKNLSNPDSEGLIYVATAALFLCVGFIYSLVNRAFLGFTPGEWAYDLRVGRPEDLNTTSYIPKLAFRQLLVFATGGILLPLLGFLYGRDLVGQITGTQLMRKV